MVKLISTQRVRDEIGSCDPAQLRMLERFVEAASDAIQTEAERQFEAATVTELVPAFPPNPFLLVDRGPIRDITSIVCVQCGQTIDVDTNLIRATAFDNAGMIRHENQWHTHGSTTRVHTITREPLADRGKPTWTVVYEGGYVTEVQAADKDSAFFEQPVTFPAALADLLTQMVASRWSTVGQPRNVTSIKNLSASISFAPGSPDFPPDLVTRVRKYRRSTI